MQQEYEMCKDCVEYGSAFCEQCLKEWKNRQESESDQDDTISSDYDLNSLK